MTKIPVTHELLTPDLIGALVEYRAWPNNPYSEYGLVESFNPTTGTVAVRFHHGDTAAKCDLRNLQLLVPALSPSAATELVERRTAMGEVAFLAGRHMFDGTTKQEAIANLARAVGVTVV